MNQNSLLVLFVHRRRRSSLLSACLQPVANLFFFFAAVCSRGPREARFEEREREKQPSAPLLGGGADLTADTTKDGSSVSIMVSLQIIYISPLFSSAARKPIKLAFPCCFWQEEAVRHPARCIVGGRKKRAVCETSARRPHAVPLRRRSATALLFLPE